MGRGRCFARASGRKRRAPGRRARRGSGISLQGDPGLTGVSGPRNPPDRRRTHPRDARRSSSPSVPAGIAPSSVHGTPFASGAADELMDEMPLRVERSHPAGDCVPSSRREARPVLVLLPGRNPADVNRNEAAIPARTIPPGRSLRASVHGWYKHPPGAEGDRGSSRSTASGAVDP